MTTFTISLPDQLAKTVDRETTSRGFATRSEFFRDILRRVFAPTESFQPFIAHPLEEIRRDMTKTGKYNKKFIDSVIAGLAKSSAYADKTTTS